MQPSSGWGGGVPDRVQDGSQDDLVGAALQDDLDVPLQQPRLGEELGLGGKWFRALRAVGFPLEGGTLQRNAARKVFRRTTADP